MAKAKETATTMGMALADPARPIAQRREILKMTAATGNDDALDSVLQALTNANGEKLEDKRLKELTEKLREMEAGPLRSGVFVGMADANGASLRRARVILEDGAAAYTVVPDDEVAELLRVGDQVLLEARGRALLQRVGRGTSIGEEARLEGRVEDALVQVTLRGQDRYVFYASQDLLDEMDAGEVGPGATLIVNSRQSVAFSALPGGDELEHYQYLVRMPVPDVLVGRDRGAPPRAIEELTTLVRLEMTQPEVRRRYRLRRCAMQLFSGVAGTGKTLAVSALWRCLYEVMSEVTGVPVEELPARVFRLRMSEILNMYLGQSDKNLERFFKEVEQLAAEPFVAPDGKEYHLPVLGVLEEIDGLAQHRGREPIYDRILTTALQWLDTSRPELKDKLVLYVGTTNEAQHVDAAFLRRIGARVEVFGRLKRGAFRSVLRKRLTGIPLAGVNGSGPEVVEREMVSRLTNWLFSPNGTDTGVVELTFAGSATAEIRYRRDFLTGAMVDRAVEQAANEASAAEHQGEAGAGLTVARLMAAFDQQVRAIADQLSAQNADRYLEVPDATRVASVRRLPQTNHLPEELQLQH